MIDVSQKLHQMSIKKLFEKFDLGQFLVMVSYTRKIDLSLTSF